MSRRIGQGAGVHLIESVKNHYLCCFAMTQQGKLSESQLDARQQKTASKQAASSGPASIAKANNAKGSKAPGFFESFRSLPPAVALLDPLNKAVTGVDGLLDGFLSAAGTHNALIAHLRVADALSIPLID